MGFWAAIFGVVSAGQYPQQLSATVAYSHATATLELASISFQHFVFFPPSAAHLYFHQKNFMWPY